MSLDDELLVAAAGLVRRLVADGEVIAERPVTSLEDIIDWTADDQSDVAHVLAAGATEVIVAIYDPLGALGPVDGLLRVVNVEHRVPA